MCWYCTHGWPEPISNIYVKAVKQLDGDETPLLYSDSHVVWEDCNFHLAQLCLDKFGLYSDQYNDEEKAVIRWSLEELLKVPSEFIDGVCKSPCPNNCSLCPPPAHWVMVTDEERRKEIYGNKS